MGKKRKKVKGTDHILDESSTSSSSSSSTSSNSASNPSEVDEIYDVECIRTWRYNKRTKKREYFIKWRNWDEKDNTWEPEDHLSCPEPMKRFLANMTKKQRKLYTHTNLDDLSGLQRNAEIDYIFATVKPGIESSDSQAQGTSSATGKRVGSRAKFQLMIYFQDEKDEFEIVTFEELFKFQPEKAFEWLEERLVDRSSLEGRSDVVKPKSGRIVKPVGS